ncbi:MAG TPA: class I SAM-dependent methyltransferase [Parasegetibacter sp.]
MTNTTASVSAKSVVHYNACPVCGSEQIKLFSPVKDYSISGEVFEVMECISCSVRFTQNAPSQEEIGPYYKAEHYISHSDSNKGLINRLYQKVRHVTVRKKANLIEEITNKHEGEVLDVGCGTGYFLAEMKSRGWTAEGLEPDPDARTLAASVNNIQSSDISHLFEIRAGSKDAVTLWHVLEHVHQLHDYMKRFKEILAPDGKLVIAVPNYTSYDSRHYGTFWAAYDVPRHLYHFSPKSLKILAERHGMQVDSLHPMWYDSFYVSMLSEKYKKGSMVKAGITGLISNFRTFFNKEQCSSLIYVLSVKI